MKHPFPLDAGTMALEGYLTMLLSALAKKAGGTLRISVSDILKVEDSVLLRYPSPDLKDVVLQLGPPGTDMYVVKEAPAWPVQANAPRQVATPPRPRVQTVNAPPTPPPPSRTASTLDNLSLYLKEQERAEQLREIQQEDELEERRRVGLSPFRTIPNK